jgi:pimeloyl-ACP methyl ester carboxylesterase
MAERPRDEARALRRIWLALEAPRASLEAASLAPAWPLLVASAPRGDGHPVLVLPGFTASDVSTTPLRAYLRARGFAAVRWAQGRNHGDWEALEHRLHARLAALHARHGRRVSLVGWSLGGVFAREIARRAPERVRQVITLASPFQQLGAPQPPPVPSTAIYSESDGIVAWRHCREREHAHTENIRVAASHCGMGFHPLVLYAIADRLAQPEGDWKPFDRRGLRGAVYG